MANQQPPVGESTFSPSAAIVGAIFTVLGVLFLLDAADLATWRFDVVLPAILIGLGVAAILGAIWRPGRN